MKSFLLGLFAALALARCAPARAVPAGGVLIERRAPEYAAHLQHPDQRTALERVAIPSREVTCLEAANYPTRESADARQRGQS